MAEFLARQRRALTERGAPTLDERRADPSRLCNAVKRQGGAIPEAVSAKFGAWAKLEAFLADIRPVVSAAHHARRHYPIALNP